MSRTVLNVAVSAAASLLFVSACKESPSSASPVEPDASYSVSAAAGPRVRLTWISVANWMIEVGGTRFLIDSYFTRPGPQPVFQPSSGGAYTFVPYASDRPLVERMLSALNQGSKPLQYILAGHTHFDHSMDIPLTAELTGAQIIGPPTMCLQAAAQDIPASQCTVVEGGEVLTLGSSPSTTTTVYVIHSNHSGGEGSVIHVPRELIRPPTVEPPTTEGGFKVGVLEDMPNGGGTRAYLIKVEGPGPKTFSIAIESSGSSFDFDEPIMVSNCIAMHPAPACDEEAPGLMYPSPAESFRWAMDAAGLDAVDVYIGFSTGAVAPSDLGLIEREIEILHPRFFLPTHESSLFGPITDGLDRPFTPSDEFLAVLAANQISLLAPRQLLDAFILDENGLKPISNRQMKRQLGLSDVQEFDSP